MRLKPVRFVGVGQATAALSVAEFTGRFVNVNAVAGIGNPGRFVQTLKELGLNPLLNSYPDHHPFTGAEVRFDNDWPVVCTEKDAIKLRTLPELPSNLYYLEVEAVLSGPDGENGSDGLATLLTAHGIRTQ